MLFSNKITFKTTFNNMKKSEALRAARAYYRQNEITWCVPACDCTTEETLSEI